MNTPDDDTTRLTRELRSDLQASAAALVAASELDALEGLASAITAAVSALKAGGTLVLCGNGGSAADAQHWAAELVGRITSRDRPAIPAVALSANAASLTAIANDHGAHRMFARQVEALVRPGDLLVAISTSGESENILYAVDAARNNTAMSVAFTGRSGGALADAADIVVHAPSDITPIVQECHAVMGHAFCRAIERRLYPPRES